MVEEVGLKIATEGLVHPFLKISRVEFHEQTKDEFAGLLFKNRTCPKKSFAQFLCSIDMRSKTFHGRVTWTFDPEAYDRVGYRMIAGGDKKGGKPCICFV
jgi:hypothetical protein